MSKPIRILGIAGSLRQKSYNRAALRAAAELVPDGASIEIFELDGLPGFNEDEEQQPPAKVVELKKRVREADAILLVTPEYNYSVPGVLKNAIDWASRPYGDSAWNRAGLLCHPVHRRGTLERAGRQGGSRVRYLQDGIISGGGLRRGHLSGALHCAQRT